MQRLAAVNGLVALVGSESYLIQVRRLQLLELSISMCFTQSLKTCRHLLLFLRMFVWWFQACGGGLSSCDPVRF